MPKFFILFFSFNVFFPNLKVKIWYLLKLRWLRISFINHRYGILLWRWHLCNKVGVIENLLFEVRSMHLCNIVNLSGDPSQSLGFLSKVGIPRRRSHVYMLARPHESHHLQSTKEKTNHDPLFGGPASGFWKTSDCISKAFRSSKHGEPAQHIWVASILVPHFVSRYAIV